MPYWGQADSPRRLKKEYTVPYFRVEALEKFVHRTVYHIEAADVKEAERLCKAGKVAYDESTVEEGDEVWLETLSVQRITGGHQ